MGRELSPAEESTAIACWSRWCDCQSRQPARDAPGRGPREAAAAERLASNRRMPKPNIGDRNSHGSVVHEFRTAKLRRGSRTFAHDQVRRGWSKIITTFQWVLI